MLAPLRWVQAFRGYSGGVLEGVESPVLGKRVVIASKYNVRFMVCVCVKNRSESCCAGEQAQAVLLEQLQQNREKGPCVQYKLFPFAFAAGVCREKKCTNIACSSLSLCSMLCLCFFFFFVLYIYTHVCCVRVCVSVQQQAGEFLVCPRCLKNAYCSASHEAQVRIHTLTHKHDAHTQAHTRA